MNIGARIPRWAVCGIFFTLDLILSTSGAADLDGGGFFKLPDTASFDTSLTDGVLSDLKLVSPTWDDAVEPTNPIASSGIAAKALPLTG